MVVERWVLGPERGRVLGSERICMVVGQSWWVERRVSLCCVRETDERKCLFEVGL